jgi:hypothetical protein
MQTYRDGLGHVYEVPDDAIAEFERRRGVLLRIAIGIKLLILCGLLYMAWLH